MPETATQVTSFSKALMLGEIHEEMVFPYPLPDEAEAEKIRQLIGAFRAYAAEQHRLAAHRPTRAGSTTRSTATWARSA